MVVSTFVFIIDVVICFGFVGSVCYLASVYILKNYNLTNCAIGLALSRASHLRFVASVGYDFVLGLRFQIGKPISKALAALTGLLLLNLYS